VPEAAFNIEGGCRGGFQYGGCQGLFSIWRQVSEVFSNMEAHVGDDFQYGGMCQRWISLCGLMLEPVLIWRQVWSSRGGFVF
jgi:hypothetical protein